MSTAAAAAADDDDDPKLPQHVVVDILKRLPVKSLLRFRCVCRSWRSTIDDPSFVALHLSESTLDTSHWYLACLNEDGPLRSMCSLFSIESLTRPCVSQVEIPFAAPDTAYGFIGSCNGLVCVTELFPVWVMYLWNLFTRKHKAIPLSGPLSECVPTEFDSLALGFGFDARSNDYKIVRILSLPNEQNRRAEVYSLSTDSWRSLKCQAPDIYAPLPSVFLKGNLHWFIFKWGDGQEQIEDASIALFDVAREVFDEMALPKDFLPVDPISLQLSVLNDLLAVCAVHEKLFWHPDDLSVCSVWVMREYGKPASWTRLYNFGVYGQVFHFDGFTRNGELLMIIADDRRLSWNPITDQFANSSISGKSHLINVVESLVSL